MGFFSKTQDLGGKSPFVKSQKSFIALRVSLTVRWHRFHVCSFSFLTAAAAAMCYVMCVCVCYALCYAYMYVFVLCYVLCVFFLFSDCCYVLPSTVSVSAGMDNSTKADSLLPTNQTNQCTTVEKDKTSIRRGYEHTISFIDWIAFMNNSKKADSMSKGRVTLINYVKFLGETLP